MTVQFDVPEIIIEDIPNYIHDDPIECNILGCTASKPHIGRIISHDGIYVHVQFHDRTYTEVLPDNLVKPYSHA